jgi:hypothetical protein
MSLRKLVFYFMLLFGLAFNACKSTRVTKEPEKPVTANPPIPKATEEKPKEAVKQKEMKIALLLPLYLKKNLEIDTSDTELNLEPQSLSGLSFYESALLAADSSEKAGMKIRLSVFDIGPDTSAKQSITLKYQALKDVDLAIINFPSYQANAVAATVSQLGIKAVIMQSNNSLVLKNNPHVVLATPSTMQQCRMMADYAADEFRYSNFVVLTRNQKRENELADIFKKQTDSLLEHKYKTESKAALLSEIDSATVANTLSPVKRTVFFLPSSDESYVSSVLETINLCGKRVYVIGLPTWENFESVQFGSMENIEPYIFSSTHIDYENAELMPFRKKFLETYKTDPLYSAYNAWELINFFAGLYKKYDHSFLDHLDENTSHTLNFIKREAGQGAENVSFSVFKIQDYQLVKVNK